MKKGTIFLLFIIILLVATNPDKSDYIEWAKEEMMTNSDNILEQGLSYLAGSAIDPLTNSNNFLIFTVFQTQVIDYTFTTIGVFGYFIPLGSTDMFNLSLSTDDFSSPIRIILIVGAVYFVFIKPLRRKEEESPEKTEEKEVSG